MDVSSRRETARRRGGRRRGGTTLVKGVIQEKKIVKRRGTQSSMVGPGAWLSFRLGIQFCTRRNLESVDVKGILIIPPILFQKGLKHEGDEQHTKAM